MKRKSFTAATGFAIAGIAILIGALACLGKDIKKEAPKEAQIQLIANSHGEAIEIVFDKQKYAALKKPVEAKLFLVEQGICHPPLTKIGANKYVCAKGEALTLTGKFFSVKKFKSIITLAAKEEKKPDRS